MRTSALEERLLAQIREAGLPEPVREHRFCPTRKWRLDFAYPGLGVGIEVEGGIFMRGRHNRPSGFVKDAEKYNTCAILGWRILRYTSEQIGSPVVVNEIRAALVQAGAERQAIMAGQRAGGA